MSALNGIVSNGSIILFVGNDIPPEFASPITFAGDQPKDQRAQGYPQARAMMVRSDKLVVEMGVSVDELTQ